MHTRHLGLALFLVALAWPGLAAVPPDAPIWANRVWEPVPSTVGGHAGMDTVTAPSFALPTRQGGLAVIQGVDPAHGVRLVGASMVKFHSLARWGWNAYGNLHNAEVVLTGDPPAKAMLGALRELNVLESQGDRVMADFVWPLLVEEHPRGLLVMRCVFRAEEPSWLYARTFVAGDPRLTIRSLSLSSFGGSTSLAPGAQQGVFGLSEGGPAPARGPLALDQYWFFAAHQLNAAAAIGSRGSAGIFLPSQLQELSYLGGGSLRLTPTPGAREVSWAISDFHESPEAWIAAARAASAERQKRLAEMAWRPDMARELQLLDADAKPFLRSLEAQSPTRTAWQKERAAVEEAIRAAEGTAVGSEEELVYGAVVQQARLQLKSLWPEAVKELFPTGAAED